MRSAIRTIIASAVLLLPVLLIGGVAAAQTSDECYPIDASECVSETETPSPSTSPTEDTEVGGVQLSDDDDALSETGTNTVDALILAAIVIAGGAVLVMVARRRDEDPSDA